MTGDNKVWVYAAGRKLSPQEQKEISEKTEKFFSTWTAHELPVQASLQLLHDIFLVIMLQGSADAISGCGIDKSVGFMKKLEAETGLQFFNRMQIELIKDGTLLVTNRGEALKMLENGEIGPETITFDKTVATLGEFEERFAIPVSRAWFYKPVSDASIGR